MHSTAADYLTFARAILAGGQLDGNRILKAETVADMGRNQIGNLALHPLSSVMPEFAVSGVTLPGALDKFGLGFALNSEPIENGRGAFTMSWLGIYNTFFWIDREKQICVVVMSQMSPGGDPGTFKMVEDFDRAVYAWLK